MLSQLGRLRYSRRFKPIFRGEFEPNFQQTGTQPCITANRR